jgi:hypothetical protein
MNNLHTTQPAAVAAQNDLTNGLFVLELEERLEMAALVSAVAASERCDVETSAETV